MNDVDLTAIMEREGVYHVRRYSPCIFTVELDDGRTGHGRSVGKALEMAQRPDAMNLRKAA